MRRDKKETDPYVFNEENEYGRMFDEDCDPDEDMGGESIYDADN